MQLETTFRGLSPADSGNATRMLEKHVARFDRLIEEPSTLRAVIDGSPEFKVTLSLHLRRGELAASSSTHEIHEAVAQACEKLKTQIVRYRHRHEADRHRPSVTPT